jgi:hypothetical protein
MYIVTICVSSPFECLNNTFICIQMLTVRRSLTEILLEVTDQEIQMVSQEELARYTAAQGISTHIGLTKTARRPQPRLYFTLRETLAY